MMKSFTTILVPAGVIAIAALTSAGYVAAQTQSQYPATQPAPAPQASPSDEPNTMPSSASGPASSGQSRDPAAAAGPPSSGRARLAALIPPGMSTREACADFASVMECATVLHAAQNLHLPFTELKSRVTSGQNLGAAIYQLKPDVDYKSEVSKAEEQAKSDLKPPQG